MEVVTAGSTYLDIDAYAGCIAYAELLNLQGEQAIAVTNKAALNSSITKTIRSWGEQKFHTGYTSQPEDTYVLIDVSDPSHFDANVDLQRVVKIIDHHTGFESYWAEKPGVTATIEHIGAACTLVYEKWLKSGLLEQMSTESAALLTAGILDNTLHFKAKITTERDIQAYKKLMEIAHLPEDWPRQYFGECQELVISDLPETIRNDSKKIEYAQLPGVPVAVAQFVLWDVAGLSSDDYGKIKQIMGTYGTDWMVNILCINEGKSYFISESPKVMAWAERVLGAHFDGDMAIADRLWLRKEIFKEDATRKERP